MDNIGPGHRTHATEGFVDDHDHGQGNNAIGPRHCAVGNAFDRGPHRLELSQRIIAQCVDHQDGAQQRQRRRGETVADIIARSDKTFFTRQGHQARGKEHITDNNRKHKDHRHGPLKADAIGLAGVTEKRIAAVLRRVEGQKEHRQTKRASSQIEIGHAVGLAILARDPAHPDHRNQIKSYDH